MHRVLILASDFPPSTYPPALRVSFFVRHLPEFGWEPTVVTVDPKYYEWPIDPESAKLLPESLEILRTKALPVKWTRKIGIGDIGLRSLWAHWQAVRSLCQSRNFDLVFISVPPYFPALLGRLIYQSFGISYVIDYIDRWITPNYWKLPGAQRPLKRTISNLMAQILEPFVLRHVGHLVGVSKGTMDWVISRYPRLTESDATEIPYGVEPDDFEYLRENPRRHSTFDPNDGLFHMVYVGVINIDMVSQLEAILRAVQSGLKGSPDIFSKLRLHFVGTTYAAQANGRYQVLPIAEKSGLRDLVDERPDRVSYLDALQILLDAGALLAFGSNQPHYTASKIFPYLLAGKPLLAVFREESNVVKILKETGAGRLVAFGNQGLSQDKVREISRHLEEILVSPPGHTPSTPWKEFEHYTARVMTERLAKVFDQVVSK